jgi:Putative bacterial sensory transduction regulator
VTRPSPPAGAAAAAAVREWLAGSGVEHEPGNRPGEHVVQLPGRAKLRTTVSLVLGERALSASAFVVRRPDENHEAVYRWLLGRNARLPGIAFSLDPLGDIYLQGRLPLAAVSAAAIDDLMGALLATADGSFDELLALGFLGSMRREWAWRISRGESTRNLEAFRHLLEPPADGEARASEGAGAGD